MEIEWRTCARIGSSVPVVVEGQTSGRLRLGLVLPVEVGQLQVGGQDGHVGRFRLVSAGFQQQHVPVGHFGQPVGHDGARRSGADDDEVVIFVNHLAK